MSKPYRIRVQDVVTAEDYSTFQIDTLPLVTQQEFAAIMEEVMEAAGWERDDQGQLSFEVAEDERYVFEPAQLQIKTILQGSERIDEEVEEWSQKQLNDHTEKLVEQREQRLNQSITQRLEENKEARRQQFETLVVDATGKAIKTAAQRLGDVQDLHEERGEDGTYRLTISIQERD